MMYFHPNVQHLHYVGFRSLVNEMIHIKLILSVSLHTHPFYSYDKFLMFKNDSHFY